MAILAKKSKKLMFVIMILLKIDVLLEAKKCAKYGCSYAGKDKGSSSSEEDNNGDCTCLSSCVAVDNCCGDYFEICTPQPSTTDEETTAEFTTTTEEDITTEKPTEEIITEKPTEEITTNIVSETSTLDETASVQTTERSTTNDNIMTTSKETTPTEITTPTYEDESIDVYTLTTTSEETTTRDTNEDCGPFPIWLNIIEIDVNGDTVQYTCSEGFTFEDGAESKSSTCQGGSGDWTPVFVQCEETSDPEAEALYAEPTEAPGAHYIGSSALFLVIGELVFLFLVDLVNFKTSIGKCMKNIKGNRRTSRRMAEDSESSDVDESSPQNSASNNTPTAIFLTSSTFSPRSVVTAQDIELTDMDQPQKVHKENMISW